MSYQPPFPPGGQPPRSTPIAGEMFQAPPNLGPPHALPPTAASFLGNQLPPQPVAFAQPTRSRGWGGYLVIVLILAFVGGIGWVVVRTVSTATDEADKAISHSNEVSDPHLSANDRSALGLSGDEQYLFDGAAPAAITTALDNGIAGQPTNFTQLSLYSDYAIASAQNPTLPDHLDQYTWRTGSVGSSTPQPTDPEAAALAFTVADVDWNAIAALTADAVGISGVEQGVVSHVIVQRDTFETDLPVVIRVYVNGPRGSAYIQAAADGTVITVL